MTRSNPPLLRPLSSTLPRVGRRTVLSLCVGVFTLAGCASTGSEEPPAPQPPVPAEAPQEPTAPPPEALAAEAVVDIRLSAEPIVIQVGETIEMRALDPTPVNADGEPVADVPVLSAPLQGPEAVMADGRITGHQEGETQLVLAVMGADRRGQPEPKTFIKRVVVQGAPVARVEVVPPDHGIFVGTFGAFEVIALTADDTPRTRIAPRWSSRQPDIASVSEGGVVRGHRVGRATITAEVEGVSADRVIEVRENPVVELTVSPATASIRTGDAVRFEVRPRDAGGEVVAEVPVTYAVAGEGLRADLGAAVYSDGAFVAERAGRYRVVASAGGVSGEAVVEARPREVREDAVQVGVGLVSDAPSSDLWVFEGRDGRDYVYVGTHDGGQKMFAWDVTDPSNPVLTDSVVVDARVVNDVKVNEDATLAVITREGASDRRNGMVILDITDPAHPSVISTYTENLTGGVHNTFIVGDLVYAVHNGTLDVHIVDISDPLAPREVGRWGIDRPGKYLHDIWVVDGIGYVSYWNDGVWIVDVGDGRWGGTPTDPVVISSYAYPEGNTHVAFPYRNAAGHTYLFVGDEIFDCEECISRAGLHEDGPRGFVHVLSMDDPEHPVEVGRYEVPEAGVHNLWVTDDRLYAAYYQGGLRVVDVSGELRGDLYRQGREIAWFPTGHPDGFNPNSPMAWGPQPFKGNVFVSDLNSGLWVIRLEPRERSPVIP